MEVDNNEEILHFSKVFVGNEEREKKVATFVEFLATLALDDYDYFMAINAAIPLCLARAHLEKGVSIVEVYERLKSFTNFPMQKRYVDKYIASRREYKND